MKRSEMIDAARNMAEIWDIIIIGGGATGLGAAVDAASRGYKILLLEMSDFAKGTSSRSTKLVHGGVRYLQQGDLPLVLEALKERGLLLQNAPHLVHDQSFVVPYYKWWKGIYYGIGLKVYDIMAGKLGMGASKFQSSRKTLKQIPALNPKKLRGSIIYHDGQFDDSRLAINLAATSAENGGVLINYMKVTDLLKGDGGKIQGVKAQDMLTEEKHTFKAHAIINATGVFSDTILKMDNSESRQMIKPSQGVHIVIDKHFLPGNSAIMIPETRDGRVLFALPWHDKIMIGTTDTPIKNISAEPEASDKEIDFILKQVGEYLVTNPARSDIRSVFAGLRPLVKEEDTKDTAKISRDHMLKVSKSGLLTIAGGKWTTYRKMAEDVIDRASEVGGLEKRDCITEHLKIHGWVSKVEKENPFYYYGSDRQNVEKIVEDDADLAKKLHPRLSYIKAEVVWATRNEMAMTVEDFNSRRTRALFLDSKASEEMAPEVARLMAAEAGYNDHWIQSQIAAYSALAKRYQVSGKNLVAV